MRVRGLKPHRILIMEFRHKSHPMRVRGLKPFITGRKGSSPAVAPHAGAWIETKTLGENTKELEVAPHAGAWIETEITN